MKFTEIIIGRTLLTGVIISVALVILGGILYLIQDGSTLVIHGFNHSPTTYFYILNAKYIVASGLWCLILTQIIRVLVTGWFFLSNKEFILAFLSLLIVCVLIISICSGSFIAKI